MTEQQLALSYMTLALLTAWRAHARLKRTNDTRRNVPWDSALNDINDIQFVAFITGILWPMYTAWVIANWMDRTVFRWLNGENECMQDVGAAGQTSTPKDRGTISVQTAARTTTAALAERRAI